jgi:hypothetical protein
MISPLSRPAGPAPRAWPCGPSRSRGWSSGSGTATPTCKIRQLPPLCSLCSIISSTDGEHQGADRPARRVHILSGPLRILHSQQFGLFQVRAIFSRSSEEASASTGESVVLIGYLPGNRRGPLPRRRRENRFTTGDVTKRCQAARRLAQFRLNVAVRETKTPARWTSRRFLAAKQLVTLIDYESKAVTIGEFEAKFVPGCRRPGSTPAR